jgi:hypothetical protein
MRIGGSVVDRLQEVPEMRQVTQILVDDHIHELELVASALRAERVRDARDAPRRTASGSRRRVGRWLVAVGTAIAGGPAESPSEPGKRAVEAA